jgi:glycosyltransferase involved in cell wall biosynthesis
MSQKPVISAVLPVYNGEAYVREAVESILAQTFADFELIIINDGSTDGSGVILRELAARDPRIVLVERANGGLVSALNEGVERAQADLIARMDADDVADPERFALQQARMSVEPELGVLGSFIRIVDKTGRFIRQGYYPVTPKETARFLVHGSPLAHPTVMMRKEAVKKVGGYRRAFSHCEDYDLWLRISELGYAIANLPKPLLNYRVHGANVSTVHREAQELGTLVARLAHRCRMAGLPDPVEGVEKIQVELIQSVPVYLRQDLDSTIFVLRHTQISLAGRAVVEYAWQDYKKLPQEARQDPLICGFLMRLLNGTVRNCAYGLAMRVLIESLWQHPMGSANLIRLRLKTRIGF